MTIRNWVADAFVVLAINWVALPPGHAQSIDIDAGRTDVEVGPQGVDVDVNAPRPQTASEFESGFRESAHSPMNHQVASWLLIDQRGIVDLANFGQQRTKSPEVAKLLEVVVRDHHALSQKLTAYNSLTAVRTTSGQDAAASDAVQRRLADGQRDARQELREANREVRRDVIRDQDGVRGPLENLADRLEDGAERIADRAERVAEQTRQSIGVAVGNGPVSMTVNAADSVWVDIHQQVSQNLSNAAIEDLESRSGYEFDAALIGMLIGSHLQQAATLEVLADKVDGDLKSVIQEALISIQQHRRAAEAVMNEIHPSSDRK